MCRKAGCGQLADEEAFAEVQSVGRQTADSKRRERARERGVWLPCDEQGSAIVGRSSEGTQRVSRQTDCVWEGRVRTACSGSRPVSVPGCAGTAAGTGTTPATWVIWSGTARLVRARVAHSRRRSLGFACTLPGLCYECLAGVGHVP